MMPPSENLMTGKFSSHRVQEIYAIIAGKHGNQGPTAVVLIVFDYHLLLLLKATLIDVHELPFFLFLILLTG
jgi:hypothetical protein